MKEVDIICFGGMDWWYHNRNHFDTQMMAYYGKKYPNKVVYINSIVMQKPRIIRGKKFISNLSRKLRSIFRGLKKVDAGFWVYSPFSLPMYHVPCLRRLNRTILRLQLGLVIRKLDIRNPIVWVACPVACDVAVDMKKRRLVYQRTDRFEDFPNVDVETIKEYDQKLRAAADLTPYVNRALYEEEADRCKKAIYVDHGVNYEMFASVETDRNMPADIAAIPRPIIGYFGKIADFTVDMSFTEQVVDRLQDKSFVFVGEMAADCSALMAKKNVWMLGPKQYEQIPHYGKCFDVAIMPWRQNRWIQACNPIKLKEYLALGKPIVSTPFPELEKYREVVYEAKTLEEFVGCIEKALAEDSPERIAARRKRVEKVTWDRNAELVLKELFGPAGGS